MDDDDYGDDDSDDDAADDERHGDWSALLCTTVRQPYQAHFLRYLPTDALAKHLGMNKLEPGVKLDLNQQELVGILSSKDLELEKSLYAFAEASTRKFAYGHHDTEFCSSS